MAFQPVMVTRSPPKGSGSCKVLQDLSREELHLSKALAYSPEIRHSAAPWATPERASFYC